MGRKKIDSKKKKAKISVIISEENLENLNDVKINKSKLVNWLLREHFGMVNKV